MDPPSQPTANGDAAQNSFSTTHNTVYVDHPHLVFIPFVPPVPARPAPPTYMPFIPPASPTPFTTSNFQQNFHRAYTDRREGNSNPSPPMPSPMPGPTPVTASNFQQTFHPYTYGPGEIPNSSPPMPSPVPGPTPATTANFQQNFRSNTGGNERNPNPSHETMEVDPVILICYDGYV